MIQVSNLTKYYGDHPAVLNVSFDVPQGQIVGFLGPNGAGKSTTMRILAGYSTATSGKASIAGFDVFTEPLKVRRHIGYLPENCPLYGEMRVIEYLRFRAGIKGLSGIHKKQRIDYVLERCWLSDVRRQIVGTLSKGYRQRVGLADSLLADPPVLILDEPTAGLDPTQIRSTRSLIRELGSQHTILLSTHILPEVEMTCDRVILIHQGQVAMSATMEELQKSEAETNRLLMVVEGDVAAEDVSGVEGVTSAEREFTEQETKLRIHSANIQELMPKLCSLTLERGWKLREIRPERETLEDIFVKVTGQEDAKEAMAS